MPLPWMREEKCHCSLQSWASPKSQRGPNEGQAIQWVKLFSGSLLHAKEVRGLPWLTQQKELVPGPMSCLKGEKVKMKTELQEEGLITGKDWGHSHKGHKAERSCGIMGCYRGEDRRRGQEGVKPILEELGKFKIASFSFSNLKA